MLHMCRQPSRKADFKGSWGLISSQCWEGEKDSVLKHKAVCMKNISVFLGSPTLGLKLVTHVKNIKVVFILSPFRFMSNAAAKGLPSKARFPGVLK